MKVIEKYAIDHHSPRWKYQLGPNTYETKDTPKRVEVIRAELEKDGRLEFVKASEQPERLITALHPYHDYVKKTSESVEEGDEFYPDLFPGEGAHLPKRSDNSLWGGIWCTDAVTPIMRATYPVARASAECALTGAEMIRSGKEKSVYALCRPSGHHAGPRVFGGYCYFNNVATAAELLAADGKVAVLDIDYHHGNGTQEFFEERKFIFTASIHGDPEIEYPYFWGRADEIGRGQGEGTNLNLPMPMKTTIGAYLDALDRFLAAMETFEPDFLIIAAGFDTHATDPIGGFSIETDDYTKIGKRLAGLGLPTLISQEGGYNTDVLGQSVASFLDGFM